MKRKDLIASVLVWLYFNWKNAIAVTFLFLALLFTGYLWTVLYLDPTAALNERPAQVERK